MSSTSRTVIKLSHTGMEINAYTWSNDCFSSFNDFGAGFIDLIDCQGSLKDALSEVRRLSSAFHSFETFILKLSIKKPYSLKSGHYHAFRLIFTNSTNIWCDIRSKDVVMIYHNIHSSSSLSPHR